MRDRLPVVDLSGLPPGRAEHEMEVRKGIARTFPERGKVVLFRWAKWSNWSGSGVYNLAS